MDRGVGDALIQKQEDVCTQLPVCEGLSGVQCTHQADVAIVIWFLTCQHQGFV